MKDLKKNSDPENDKKNILAGLKNPAPPGGNLMVAPLLFYASSYRLWPTCVKLISVSIGYCIRTLKLIIVIRCVICSRVLHLVTGEIVSMRWL